MLQVQVEVDLINLKPHRRSIILGYVHQTAGLCWEEIIRSPEYDLFGAGLERSGSVAMYSLEHKELSPTPQPTKSNDGCVTVHPGVLKRKDSGKLVNENELQQEFFCDAKR